MRWYALRAAAALILIGVLIFAVRLFERRSPPQPSTVKAAPVRPQAADIPANAFMTESGLLLPLPEGYGARSRPSQNDPDLEIVLIHPLETDPERLWGDKDRLDKGAMVLEAVPLTPAERAEVGLRERLERDTLALAKERGWTLSMQRRGDLVFPATAFLVKDPPHQRVYLFDEGHIYKFSAGSGSLSALAAMLKGVRRGV